MGRFITPEPPFVLAGVEMTRHPKRAVTVNRIASALTILGFTALFAALATSVTTLVHLVVADVRDWHDLLNWWHPAMASAAVLPVALYAWRWNRIRAAWAFQGYHLGDEELYVRNGLLTRRFSAIPYARIQEVKVQSGPLQRRYRLATLTISTAAIHHHGLILRTAAGPDVIEDLDPDVARALRDRITELARPERLPV